MGSLFFPGLPTNSKLEVWEAPLCTHYYSCFSDWTVWGFYPSLPARGRARCIEIVKWSKKYFCIQKQSKPNLGQEQSQIQEPQQQSVQGKGAGKREQEKGGEKGRKKGIEKGN